jgi:hypothetical protein
VHAYGEIGPRLWVGEVRVEVVIWVRVGAPLVEDGAFLPAVLAGGEGGFGEGLAGLVDEMVWDCPPGPLCTLL